MITFGGENSNVKNFHPEIWGDDPSLTQIFSDGLSEQWLELQVVESPLLFVIVDLYIVY